MPAAILMAFYDLMRRAFQALMSESHSATAEREYTLLSFICVYLYFHQLSSILYELYF